MAKIIAYVQTEVRDKHGQLKSFKKKEANSLIKNFINELYSLFANATISSVIDTAGTSRTLSNASGSNMYMTSTDNVQTNGIVVGSGSQAVAITDTKLQTQINTGDIAGTLHYLVPTFTTPSTAGGTHSFTASRGFTNNSGAPITVNEVGIYNTFNTTTGYTYFCVERTLLTFSIAAGATGTVTYTIQVTV